MYRTMTTSESRGLREDCAEMRVATRQLSEWRLRMTALNDRWRIRKLDDEDWQRALRDSEVKP